MRLADFILRDMESILAKWEAFAATRLPAAASMASLELRDHAQQILEAVAADLSAPQSREAQAAKSMGLAPAPFPARETAAQTHAVMRARSGYDIKQLASEYRALRASVLSLWMDACLPAAPPLQDVIRFNEAIDQALAESIGHFSAQVDQARNLLLGMLSHDMRSPLQTVQMTALYLGQLNAGSDVSDAATRLIRSGARLQALVDDIVDFNRTNLGLGHQHRSIAVGSRGNMRARTGAVARCLSREPTATECRGRLPGVVGRETGAAVAWESRRQCNQLWCTGRFGARRGGRGGY